MYTNPLPLIISQIRQLDYFCNMDDFKRDITPYIATFNGKTKKEGYLFCTFTKKN